MFLFVLFVVMELYNHEIQYRLYVFVKSCFSMRRFEAIQIKPAASEVTLIGSLNINMLFPGSVKNQGPKIWWRRVF